MSDVDRAAEADWHDKTLTEFQRGYLKGERDARMALGPQLTPEQARVALSALGTVPLASRLAGHEAAFRTLSLIAERGGNDG